MSGWAKRSKIENKPKALKLLWATLCKTQRGSLGFLLSVSFFGLVVLLPTELIRVYVLKMTAGGVPLGGEIVFFVIWGCVLSVLVFSARAMLVWLQEKFSLAIESHLRRDVLIHLQGHSLDDFSELDRFQWATQLKLDLSGVERFITESLTNQIKHGMIVVLIAVVFPYHGGILALVSLGITFIFGVSNFWVQSILERLTVESKALHGRAFHSLVENLDGLKTLRSFEAEPYVQRRFELQLIDLKRQGMGLARQLALLVGTHQALSQTLMVLLLIVVATQAINGRISVENAVVFPIFIGLFWKSLQPLMLACTGWTRFFIEGGRLAEFYECTHGSDEGDEFELPQIGASSVTLDGIRVGSANEPSHAPFHLNLLKHQVAVVLGGEGTGKSTLVEVLAGLRHFESGAIHLLDQQGKAFWSRVGPGKLPIGLVALVEQDPYIFKGTFIENITLGIRRQFSDVQIWNAVERAGLYEFAQLRGGLNFELKDSGSYLSSDERYRIGLARALLLDRPILVLDEPFASVSESESHHLINLIRLESNRRTVVLTAASMPKQLESDPIKTVCSLAHPIHDKVHRIF